MESLKKSLLEAGRIAVIAIIPVLIDGLSQGAIDWRTVGIVGGIAVLRFVDKWLHESGKAEKGLTRF